MRLLALLPSISLASCFATGAVYAQVLPTGPHAMSGIAGISTVGSMMSVTTNANRSMINWQTFSIGSGAAVTIQQPGATSAILNRVVGSGGAIDPSVILGTLQSNGRVFLLNPSGIMFGSTAQIDVAGLVASSLNLSNADFLVGRLNFTAVPGAGAVVSQGTINTSSGGQVYLVGPAVTNSGVITSPQGEVILAAGNTVELVDPGTPNLRVEITAPDNEAKNLGSIVAQSGRIGIYAGLITSSGTLNADRAVVGPAGEILLKATGNISIEGTVTAIDGSVSIETGSGASPGGSIPTTGGTITVTGGGLQGGSITINTGNSLAGRINLVQSGSISPGAGATTLGATGTAVAGGSTINVGIVVTAGGGLVLVGQNSQTVVTSDQVAALSFNSLDLGVGSGSIVVNANNTITVVGRNGQVTFRADQVRNITANNLTVPVSALFGLGSLTLQRTTDLLPFLPVGQAVSRTAAQVNGNMSAISQVNDFTRNPGGAAPNTLTPLRTTFTVE